jgi:hypothetical protein
MRPRIAASVNRTFFTIEQAMNGLGFQPGRLGQALGGAACLFYALFVLYAILSFWTLTTLPKMPAVVMIRSPGFRFSTSCMCCFCFLRAFCE